MTNIITPGQSGFQLGRMTLDVHANIVQEAMDSLQEKRSIFAAVDLEATFDRVWRGCLLKNLAKFGLHPKALRSLKSFQADRMAKVNWEESQGRYLHLKEGVPQASPLNPLFFCLATAKLPKAVNNSVPNCQVDHSADDVTICTPKKVIEASNHKQRALNAVEQWPEDNGIKIAGEKAAIVVISVNPRNSIGKANTSFRLAGEVVTPSKEVETLGVTVDSQLTFAIHAQKM